MKVSLKWLKDYVDITLPVPDLAERMTLAGLEVEQIQYIGVEGADLDLLGGRLTRSQEGSEKRSHHQY